MYIVVDGPVAKIQPTVNLSLVDPKFFLNYNSIQPPLRPIRVSIIRSIVSAFSDSTAAATASCPQSTSTRSSEPVSSAESSL